MYCLLAVMVISRLLAHNWITGIEAERKCHALTAEIGDTIAVMLEVRNRSSWPIPWVILEDQLPRPALEAKPPDLEITGTRTRLAMLRGRKSLTMLYQVACRRRGYYQLGPLVIETGDLFGLHRRWRIGTEPHYLLVYPRVVPLEGYDIASPRPVGQVRMSYRLDDDPTRISGTRRYEAGDPLNRVHWRATARTGILHSKVFEPSTVAGATILLEFNSAAYDRRFEPNISDMLVTAAASIANALYQMGQQVGLVTNGRDAADRIPTDARQREIESRADARRSTAMRDESDRIRPVVVETRRGPDQFNEILGTLARLELGDGLSFSQLVVEADAHTPRSATVIALLPTVNDDNTLALAGLSRRGYAVVAILSIEQELAFAEASEPLHAEGIATVQLRDEDSIAHVCQSCASGSSAKPASA